MDSSLQSVSIEQRLAQLSDEFADRIRNGEQPGIEEYVDRHPEMEQIIRRVLPAVEVMCGLTTDHGSRPVTSWTNWESLVTFASSVRSDAVAWPWSMRPSKYRWPDGWR